MCFKTHSLNEFSNIYVTAAVVQDESLLVNLPGEMLLLMKTWCRIAHRSCVRVQMCME